MGPEHHAKFQKKTNEPILRKRTDRWNDGRKDGRKDGKTLFYRTLPVEAGGPITVENLNF